METEMEKSRFKCLHPGCTASYRRKEHLVRHAARHSQTRSFTCSECGVSFDRSDTLRRHKKIHFKPDEPITRVAKACDRCHVQKSKCDGNIPCGICARKGLKCSFERGTITETENTNLLPQRMPRGFHSDGSERARKQIRLDQPDHRQEEMSESFAALWGPKLQQPDSLSSSSLSKLPAHALRTALLQHETQLQDDAVKLAEQHNQTKTMSLKLGDLFDLSFCESEDASFASAIDVEYYVNLYFEHFHPFWPFIMKVSFNPKTEPFVLVLATTMIGLWVTGEARLRKLAWTIHSHLHVTLQTQISTWCVRPKTGRNDTSANSQAAGLSKKRWPLATYQAILLFTIFGITAHDPADVFAEGVNEDILDRIRPIFIRLVRTCHAQGVFYYPAMLAQGSAGDPFVFAWSNLEELKYFALTLYKVSVIFSRLSNIKTNNTDDNNNNHHHHYEEDVENNNNSSSSSDSIISLSDLQFPVPDNGYLWSALGVREFFRRRELQLRDPVTLPKTSISTSTPNDTAADGPWISEIVGEKAKGLSVAQRRKAWMSLGPFLGYLVGVDPSLGAG